MLHVKLACAHRTRRMFSEARVSEVGEEVAVLM